MSSKLIINVCAFPVTVLDQRSGRQIREIIVLDKQQLKSAQIARQSLIERILDGVDFRVLDIGKAEKRTLSIDLEVLFDLNGLIADERN